MVPTMLKLQLVLGIVSAALWVYCLIEVVSTPDDRVRNLRKLWWLLLVLLFPLAGSLAWLVAGHPQGAARSGHHGRPDVPEYDRPGRFVATEEGRDEESLRGVRERAEEQRRRHEAERRRREQQQRGEEPEPSAD